MFGFDIIRSEKLKYIFVGVWLLAGAFLLIASLAASISMLIDPAKIDWSEAMNWIAPSIIGLAVVYHAHLQVHISTRQNKYNEFHRRFEMFEATNTYLVSSFRNRELHSKNLTDFHDATRGARFIFDDDIGDYLTEVSKLVTRYRFLENQVAKNIEENKDTAYPEKLKDASVEILIHQRNLETKFEDYLDLTI